MHRDFTFKQVINILRHLVYVCEDRVWFQHLQLETALEFSFVFLGDFFDAKRGLNFIPQTFFA